MKGGRFSGVGGWRRGGLVSRCPDAEFVLEDEEFGAPWREETLTVDDILRSGQAPDEPPEETSARVASILSWSAGKGGIATALDSHPVLLCRGQGGLRLIDGYHRALAAREEGVVTLAAVVLDGTGPGHPPPELTPTELSRRLLDAGAHDLAGRLTKRQTGWIARHSDRWVLTRVPVLNEWDTAPGGRSVTSATEPIIVHIDRQGAVRILDGQHRYSEANARGQRSILAYVPERDRDVLREAAALGEFPSERAGAVGLSTTRPGGRSR